MKKLPFNRKITLLTLEPQNGRSEPAEIARATVWANVSDVGSTTKLAALQAGQTVSLAVTMWRKEYRDYSHAEVDGTRFKIVETGSAKSDLHIKLLLERG